MKAPLLILALACFAAFLFRDQLKGGYESPRRSVLFVTALPAIVGLVLSAYITPITCMTVRQDAFPFFGAFWRAPGVATFTVAAFIAGALANSLRPEGARLASEIHLLCAALAFLVPLSVVLSAMHVPG